MSYKGVDCMARDLNAGPEWITPLQQCYCGHDSMPKLSTHCHYRSTHRVLFISGGRLDINCEFRIYLLEADSQMTQAHHYDHANARIRVS